MRATRLVLAATLVAAAYAATGLASVQAAPVQISSTSPFGALGDCGDAPGVPAGVNFVNSEVEPWIDVNPIAPGNIVAFWQQDRWSNGGARGNVAGVTFDGGTTWQIAILGGLTVCDGGSFDRASDPWISFGPDGTLHQVTLAFDADPALGSFGRNALLVSRSVDGGLTWSAPVTVIRDDAPNVLNDKQSLTADPTDPALVYVVWDRLRVPMGTVVSPENAVGLGFKSPFYFARSTDGGATYEPARRIYDPGANNQTIGHQLVVLPDGTLIDFFNEILNFRNDDGDAQFDINLAFLRSTDKGETWLPHGRPVRTNDVMSLGVVTPDRFVPVRDADILFDVAVDPVGGNLYAVWQDARFTGVDAIAFSMSSDGGFTWTQPIKVNQTPGDVGLLRGQAFVPQVAVSDQGVVAVTYYDFRNDDMSGELADYFAVRCLATCSDPASWGAEERLTAQSFDILAAPFANGLFLGDYMGLAQDGEDFLSAFAISGAGDPSSVFFARTDFGM